MSDIRLWLKNQVTTQRLVELSRPMHIQIGSLLSLSSKRNSPRQRFFVTKEPAGRAIVGQSRGPYDASSAIFDSTRSVFGRVQDFHGSL